MKDKEGHCIMIKGSVQEEDIIFLTFMHPTKPLNIWNEY